MHRVVVTGYGAITPLGLNASETWDNLLAGRSGVAPITLFDASEFETTVAAEVKNFDPEAMLDRRAARRLDRKEQLANVAANEALAHAGLAITEENRERIGVSIACAFGGITSLIDDMEKMIVEGPKAMNPLGILKYMTTSPSVSMNHDLRGPSFATASACASGADGIGLATLLIQTGRADAMLAGGTDAVINPFYMTLLTRMRAQSQRSEGTPSPFSANRDGLISGEGAAVVVLESLESAQARGANILAEIVGYGTSSDAFHITAPREDNTETARAIRLALDQARLNPEDVDYVNAHGTGTPLNDPAETMAIKLALGDHAFRVPVSSTKSMTGHMMAAAGAVEAVIAIQSIRHGAVPPTINLTEPDPACDLDYVTDGAREKPVKAAISNSFGFGGHNAVLAFRAFTG
jgi:beta-ketoacyl-acyl-carrier-protein synthase II